MSQPKYPSLAELRAQGVVTGRAAELARQAESRKLKNQREIAQQWGNARLLDALVEHVSAPMRRNDHEGVIKALHDVRKHLKL